MNSIFLSGNYFNGISFLFSSLLLLNGIFSVTAFNTSRTFFAEEGSQRKNAANSFWVLAEVTNLHWKTACISSQLCADPKFTLSQKMHKFSEHMAQDWQLTKTVISDYSLKMYTFWYRGEPNEISIQAYVLGTDPKFKFSRVCDETPSVYVFQTMDRGNGRRRERESNEEEEEGEDGGIVQLELHGFCFNATLTFRLYRKRCPWCEPAPSSPAFDHRHSLDVQSMGSHQMPASFLQMRTHMLIFLLAIATAVNVFAFLGLLFICIRQCRAEKQGSTRDNSFSASTPNPAASIDNSPISLPHKMANFSPTRDYSPPLEMAPEVPRGYLAYPLQGYYYQQQAEQFRQFFSLPAIQEEHYEVINDEHILKKSAESGAKKKVRLPQSSQCHHCFLRLQEENVGIDNQLDRCSCASLTLDDGNAADGVFCTSSTSSSSTTTSFSSTTSTSTNDDGSLIGGKQ